MKTSNGICMSRIWTVRLADGNTLESFFTCSGLISASALTPGTAWGGRGEEGGGSCGKAQVDLHQERADLKVHSQQG